MNDVVVSFSLDELAVIRNAVGSRSVQLDDQISNLDDAVARLLANGPASALILMNRHRASLVVERDSLHRLDSRLLAAFVPSGVRNAQG